MERDQRLEIKVGLFVGMGVFMLLLVMLALGSEENLFEKNYVLHSSFSDISGLREGAVVRLAGMDVGIVSSIDFPEDVSEKEVFVDMRVSQRFAARIRKDTKASIKTQGVLGDKYIALSVGSAEEEQLVYDDWIEGVAPDDLMDGVAEIKANILSITHTLDVMLKGDDGQAAGQSIAEMLQSLRNILHEVEQGEGVIHALVYDEKAGEDLKGAIEGIEGTATSLAAILEEIESGDGSMHALVYDDQLAGLVTSLESTASSLDELVLDIKEGDGMIHSLVYTDEGANLITNLTEASADIRDVTGSIKAGEGTLGALIADPTVYEDVKTLLGGAQRNKVLRAYVRDTIRKNERGVGLSDGGGVQEE